MPGADAERVAVAPRPAASRTSVRLVVGYIVLIAFTAAAATISILGGRNEEAAPPVGGVYEAPGSACLGERFTLEQSGEYLNLDGDGSEGKLRLRDGNRVTGDVDCATGGTAAAALTLTGEGEDARLRGTVGDEQVSATFAEELPEPGAGAEPEKRSAEETFGRLMLAVAAVIFAARLFGAALSYLAQPRVMGEVLGGILLGPTLLGAIAPDVKDYLFPADIVPLLTAGAQIGLAFYLFLVGLELDIVKLQRQLARAAFISNASVAIPMSLGLLVALPVYELLSPDVDYLPFALFMGIAMSITAFPVLARILVEKRMLRSRVGVIAMAGAAIDDVTAWALLALGTAFATGGTAAEAGEVIGYAALFSAGLLFVGRPLLRRAATAYDEVGRLTPLWLGVIVIGVLVAAYVSREIGIAAIFGAFMVGLIMPRHEELTHEVNRRFEDFVVTVLLPLFFVVTGLRTDIGAIDRLDLWLIGLVLLGVAVVGKWVGAMIASRVAGFDLRDSAVIGALMNTRGLTELIVLNIGLDLGLISPALFTILVLMALITTFAAGPALRLLDPRGELSEPLEKQFRRLTRGQRRAPEAERSIIVAPQDDRSMDSLLAIAEPLAQSDPPRELLLVRLLDPVRLAAGLSSEDRQIRRVETDLNHRRELLLERDVAARAVAFTSPDPGQDLVRLASDENVDLVLVNGRRPVVGEPVPAGTAVLGQAPCDVAVLVEREGEIVIDAKHPVVVPFGGAEHDWAALELGAWIASGTGAPLRLLGAAGGTDGERDASRLLANAALVVQQLAGVETESVLVEPGRTVIEAAEGGGLLIVGLSERFKEEGLGPLRTEIARRKPAPTLFVRRGKRPGALAPKEEMTRFRWSAVGPAPPGAS